MTNSYEIYSSCQTPPDAILIYQYITILIYYDIMLYVSIAASEVLKLIFFTIVLIFYTNKSLHFIALYDWINIKINNITAKTGGITVNNVAKVRDKPV